MKKTIFILSFLPAVLFAQIGDITRLPCQDPGQYYQESSPIAISENEIIILFLTLDHNPGGYYDTLYSARSTDGGITWGNKKFIMKFEAAYAYNLNYLSSLRTSSGKILAGFRDWHTKKINIIHSDDNGISWSDPIIFSGSNFKLSEVFDRIIISILDNSSITKTFYRVSYDQGDTWSDEIYDFDYAPCTFIGLGNETILSFFKLNGGIYKKISTDNGQLWSDNIEVLDSAHTDISPQVLKGSANDLWITYQTQNTFLHYNDIYYLKSSNEGETWNDPVRFTSYAGKDENPGIALLGDKPFIIFSSTRFANKSQIVYAILGETIEVFRPPYITNCQTSPDSSSKNKWIIKCNVIDDQSVAKVTLEPELGHEFELYDDGKHNDIDSADNYFGNIFYLDFVPPSDMAIMNVNRLKIPFGKNGVIAEVNQLVNLQGTIKAVDNEDQQISDTENLTLNYIMAPQYDESSFLFSGGFFLSGYTNEKLWINFVAQAALANDYLPGRCGDNPRDPINKVYVVKKEDVPFGYYWQQWKNAVNLGAEFYDGDGDGIYKPVDKNWNGTWDKNEDMPMIIGDETAWCVYNDGLPKEQRFWPVDPQGIEIKQTAFASDIPDLENVIFIRYSMLNTGTISDLLDSVYFGIWEDPDLGNFEHNLVGCDTILNSGFVYNNEYDQYYGDNSPSFFTTILQGPITESAGDTAYNNSGIMYGSSLFPEHKNLNMSAHIFFIPGGSFYSIIAARNQLLGRYEHGSYPNPCDSICWEVRGGVNCHSVNPVFWLSGDPVSDYGWIFTCPQDIRNMISTGPFKLENNKPQEIIIAYVLGRGSDPINSITVARENVRKAIREYKSNFTSLTYSPPPASYPVINYKLYQNYPNPFNPATKIRYELPKDGMVTIEIFDILGQKIKTLLNNFQKADRYEVEFNGTALASGVYIYRIKVNEFIASKKMVLIR